MTTTALVITTLAGLGAGALAGLFGVGGGFLIVPLLTSFLDLPAAVIVGSTGCAVLGPASTSLLARQTRFEDWRFPLTLFAGLMVGVIFGASLLDRIAVDYPESVEPCVLAVYCVLLSSLGLWTALDVIAASSGRTRLPRGWLNAPTIRPIVPVRNRRGVETPISIPIAVAASIVVGGLCGLLGISGGLVTVPLFAYGFGLRIRLAVRLSLITVWLASLQSTLVHSWLDHVELRVVICLLLGGTVGARLATNFSRRLSPVVLRGGFAALLIACAVFVFVRLWLTQK